MNILEQILAIANDGQAIDPLGDIVKLAREYLDSDNMIPFPEAGERLWIVPGTMTTSQSESDTGEQAGSKVPRSAMRCPFCEDDDFDAIGLKAHLLRGHCPPFEATVRPDEERFDKPRHSAYKAAHDLKGK